MEPETIHRNGRIAATRAARILGPDWFARGYRIRPAPLLTGSTKLTGSGDLPFLTEAETFLSPDNAE